MSVTPADSRDPAVIALCLDWLHDTLPWPMPVGDWGMRPSGFTQPKGARSTRSWRSCEQCGGTGETRRGKCSNCEGAGGWHYDPMDETRSPLRTSADAHPELDRPVVRVVRLTLAMERPQIERELGHELPYPLTLLVEALHELRLRDRPQRAILQRVHVLRLDPCLRDAEVELYDAALAHLGQLIGHGFRAPRRYRVMVAEAQRAPEGAP